MFHLALSLLVAPAAFAVMPSDPVAGSFAIGAPIHRDGLTVYPILNPGAEKAPDEGFLTLADALAIGALTVTEQGHGMQVASLRVHNRGKVPVLVMAGEMVEGGHQDRVITQDLVVPPSDAPMVVQVNCVERGRWEGGHQFAYGGRAELGLRRVVQVRRDQGATWEAVASMNSSKAALLQALGHDPGVVSSPTETYLAGTRARAIERQVAKLTLEIDEELAKEADVVGVVVAVGGEVVGGEIYGHTEVFDAVRRSTLAAVARDVMTTGTYGVAMSAPDVAVAAAFLDDALAGRVVAHHPGPAGATRALEGEDTVAYALDDEDGDLVHLTAYRR